MEKLIKKFNEIYTTKGIDRVYKLANKLNLPYANCSGCESSTPTLKNKFINECAICGLTK